MPEFADDVFRLNVEYMDDDKIYFFSIQNPAGHVVRSFSGGKAANGKAYISIEGIRILYDTEADCVLAGTDSDAQRATTPYRAPDGSIYYGLDQAKVKHAYIVIKDSPEEVFEMGRLKTNRPVTQEDVENIKNLSDECWIGALKEFRQPR